MRTVCVTICALTLWMSAGVAAAQDESDEGTNADGSGEQNGSQAKTAIFAEGGSEGATEGQSSEGSHKPTAAAAARSWSFGPYFRFVVVPAFMLKLFLDEAPSPSNVGFGASATYRTKDGSPNFDFGIGYTGYSFTGPFRTKGGDLNDTEIVKSNLGLVHLTGSILWEAPIVPDKLSFQYGVGIDLGIVTGKMVRTEAYPLGNGKFAACQGPNIPDPANCMVPLHGSLISDPYNVKGEQYGQTDKSIPPVMALPMLPRLGLRYAPIPDLWVRLDAAYGIAQFWFGLSVAYVPAL